MVEPLPLPDGVAMPEAGLMRCENGELILSYLRCDGQEDCHDGGDEQGCMMGKV